MKLTEGTYENLITHQLQSDIQDSTDSGLICKEDSIDDVESPSMLTEHLCKIIKNRLSDENLTYSERTELVNRIINDLVDDSNEKVIDTPNMLTSVISREKETILKATKEELIRPLSGFRVSNLFTGGTSKLSLNSEIERDIESADRISILVSFLKLSGVNLIYDSLKRFCENPKHKLRIITTTYCGVTDVKAVERLSKLPNTEIKISYNTSIERLHAKSYIFERNSGFSTAYIGSSNLSKSAQTDGLEWNIRVTNIENPHIIKTALSTFNIYWNSSNFEDFSINGIEKLRKELGINSNASRNDNTVYTKYSILPHQKQILDRLQYIRQSGIEDANKNLIVAATGTGKTVISAFDYKLFREKHPSKNRLLFIAHRSEILTQACKTYRSVLQDFNFGEIWVGTQKPSNNIDHLFVSVQTFNSKYDDIFSNLPCDYYDYIVIDEAHHITAKSYREILTKFNPKILLGLTATPERMDGESLLPDFGNHISAEIRLPKALDDGLLTPFQYLCISDNVDLSEDDLMQGSRYVADKITDKLCNSERVNLIIDRLTYYLPNERECKALGFCATKAHARYMAKMFQERNLKAEYLTSDNEKERNTLNKKLATGEINYLFVVDIFNEGVDIPEVDTVLFLRPTESLTIFLQQLGRGLRLAPGKQLLTVFDFVCQLNKKYDFSSRFRSLLKRNDQSVINQIKKGFTLLPYGCTIHMEEKAQQYILDNINAAIYNNTRLIRELQTYDHCPTIGEFLSNNGQDIRLLYKNKSCWSKLKKAANLCDYESDANTDKFEKCISKLLHANSINYLQFVKRIAIGTSPISISKDEEIYSTMLYYSLFGDTLAKTGFDSVPQALNCFREYSVFTKEVAEIVDYLIDNIETKTFAVGEGMPIQLEQYGCYTREEIFTLFGRQTANKKMQGSVSGVFNIEELNTELFFVTLNKSDKEFSPSTMYDDHVICENKFHWKSQNTDSHSGRGRRFVEQKTNGKKFLLFVREYKNDGYGNTCPFICFGLVDYIESYDDKPMSIDWRVHHPILPQFICAV